MSKSVLVIDTPESCRECNFRKYNEFGRCYVCAAKNNYMIDRDVNIDIIQDWCPLSPLPPHKDLTEILKKEYPHKMTDMAYMYGSGWNAFREEILKGAKNE